MSKEKHSPTPWSFDGGLNIFDANGREINCPNCYDDNMRFIVEAVNDHAKMHEVAMNLLRSRDAAIEDGNRLRNLVRDLADALDEAWGHQPPTTDAALLTQARKAIGEGGAE